MLTHSMCIYINSIGVLAYTSLCYSLLYLHMLMVNIKMCTYTQKLICQKYEKLLKGLTFLKLPVKPNKTTKLQVGFYVFAHLIFIYMLCNLIIFRKNIQLTFQNFLIQVGEIKKYLSSDIRKLIRIYLKVGFYKMLVLELIYKFSNRYLDIRIYKTVIRNFGYPN